MTHHSRKARKRRTLTRKERTEIADALRLAVHHGGNSLTMQDMLALASEMERATVIIEAPQSRAELERVSLRTPKPEEFHIARLSSPSDAPLLTAGHAPQIPVRGSDSLSDPRD